MKAIQITAENQQMLAARYHVEDYETILPIGYYLVAPFGTTDTNDEYYEGLLTLEKLNELYVIGETLANGFFAITPR